MVMKLPAYMTEILLEKGVKWNKQTNKQTTCVQRRSLYQAFFLQKYVPCFYYQALRIVKHSVLLIALVYDFEHLVLNLLTSWQELRRAFNWTKIAYLFPGGYLIVILCARGHRVACTFQYRPWLCSIKPSLQQQVNSVIFIGPSGWWCWCR
jgi:hypothetical protein